MTNIKLNGQEIFDLFTKRYSVNKLDFVAVFKFLSNYEMLNSSLDSETITTECFFQLSDEEELNLKLLDKLTTDKEKAKILDYLHLKSVQK